MPAAARALDGDAIPGRVPPYVRLAMRDVQRELERSKAAGETQRTGLLKGRLGAGGGSGVRSADQDSEPAAAVAWLAAGAFQWAGHACPALPTLQRQRARHGQELDRVACGRQLDCYWLFGKAYECATCRDLNRRVEFREKQN